MKTRKIIVSGVGCCLVDRIYNGISFSSETFSKYLSRQHGDGGLEPGKLEFEEGFERFCNRRFPEVLQDITGGRPADTVNIGGPCIVALINAAHVASLSVWSITAWSQVQRRLPRLFSLIRTTMRVTASVSL